MTEAIFTQKNILAFCITTSFGTQRR